MKKYRYIFCILGALIGIGADDAHAARRTDSPAVPAANEPDARYLTTDAPRRFKNAEAYIAYVDSIQKPRAVVFGSRRGKYSSEGNVYMTSDYASSSYEFPYRYLLVDYSGYIDGSHALETENEGKASAAKADVDCNIMEIDPRKFGGEGLYDYVIFEHVNLNFSFSRKAIQGALRLLKPGGALVSSGLPNLTSEGLLAYMERVGRIEHINGYKLLQFSPKTGGSFYYRFDESEALRCPLDRFGVYRVETKYTDRHTEKHPPRILGSNTTDFWNANKAAVFTYLGEEISKDIKELTFINVDELDQFISWPQKTFWYTNAYYDTDLMFIRKK